MASYDQRAQGISFNLAELGQAGLRGNFVANLQGLPLQPTAMLPQTNEGMHTSEELQRLMRQRATFSNPQFADQRNGVPNQRDKL